MANLKNTSNEYALALGAMFDEMPKSVIAAIAVSAMTCGGDHLSDAVALVAGEWRTLHENRIVPQKPGKHARNALKVGAA
ncbi:MAG: hypothetical protein ABF751_09795 [Acetobacter orientalis]|uniref:hypothetical protein n=1 Tax=Acetobacter TaxID=434 RepID=UPI0039EC4840